VRALVIHRYGGPDKMVIEDRPAPAVGPRDALIRVRAASLNPLDFKLRQGGPVRFVLEPAFPIILGCDVAGVVEQVGGEVSRFRAGDEVFARLEKSRMGGLAELVAADHSVIAPRPRNVSMEEAASIPLAGLTALQALRDVARVQPGQRVLIHAGAGGVGSLAVQIAHKLGAHVLTTCSGGNADLVRSLGADEVIDYTRENVGDRAGDLDAVLDTLGGASELTSLALCRRGGVVVGIGGMPDADFVRDWMPSWFRPLVWLVTARRRRAAARAGASFRYLFMRPDGAQLAELAGWIEDGSLRPLVHRVYPLADAHQAFAELERGHTRGKIVVTPP
jgi:NADPH:quinone reductase-like Zn-dependent oxidoreductase